MLPFDNDTHSLQQMMETKREEIVLPLVLTQERETLVEKVQPPPTITNNSQKESWGRPEIRVNGYMGGNFRGASSRCWHGEPGLCTCVGA